MDLEWALQFNATLLQGVRGSRHPFIDGYNQSPDTDSLFNATPRLRAQLAQLQNTLSQQMNKPAFQLTPLGAAFRLKTNQKETSLHHPKKHAQATLRQPY